MKYDIHLDRDAKTYKPIIIVPIIVADVVAKFDAIIFFEIMTGESFLVFILKLK